MRFLQFIREATKPSGGKPTNPVVFAFGRMNPPTVGHGALVDKVKELADKHEAHHEIVLSHSVDPKKNPLTPEQKLTHARRMFPNTNISASSPDQPTLLHHLARLHKAGHDHAIIVAGDDRVPEFTKLVNHYNTNPDKSGKQLFNFKKIDVVSSGARDPDAEGVEGMSASKMRDHASKNDYASFKQGLPKKMLETHAQEMFSDVQKGLK
jgi:cytidyltransferase-like protein